MAEKLGNWLLKKGRITREQLDRALRDQSFFGDRLGNTLVKLGFVDQDVLGQYLSDITHTPYASSRQLQKITPEVIATVPARVAAKYCIIPIAIEKRKLHLAMRDPKDLLEAGAAAPPSPPRAAGKRDSTAAQTPEIGLDGLPLDADPSDLDQPFVTGSGGAPPPMLERSSPIPASLEDWRAEPDSEPGLAQPPRPAAAAQPPQAAPPAAPPAATTTQVAAAAVPAMAAPALVHAAAPGHAPAPTTMDAIAARLRQADTRDDVFGAILDFTTAQFRRAALFVVQQDNVLGWSGRGTGLSPLRIRNVVVRLDHPSLFIFFRSGADYFYGPVPDLPANAKFYLDLGVPPPARVLLLPLVIKDKPSVILYADNGPDTATVPDIQQYRRLLQKAALALEVLILRNKIMMI